MVKSMGNEREEPVSLDSDLILYRTEDRNMRIEAGIANMLAEVTA